jgi:hypothetical protein
VSRRCPHPKSLDEPPRVTADHSVKEILATMHTELQMQRQRKINVVVAGLKPLDGVADADLCDEICENCLPVKSAPVQGRCRSLW